MGKVAIFDAKNRFAAIVHQAEAGAPIELTRHGKAVAVLVGIDRFRELEAAAPSFASAYRAYAAAWREALAADSPSAYDDPFAGVRDAAPGRLVKL